MKKLIILTLGVLAICGCATKTRSIDCSGLFCSELGQLAIGSVEVQSIAEGDEAALIKYSEDYPMLAFFFSKPEKMRNLGITLTGSNTTCNVTSIVKDICIAFVATHPANTNAALRVEK